MVIKMTERNTLTQKQIKAKLESLLYSFQVDTLLFDLMDGIVEQEAENTDLAPYVENANKALCDLIIKFDEMCEEYNVDNFDEE